MSRVFVMEAFIDKTWTTLQISYNVVHQGLEMFVDVFKGIFSQF